MKPSRVTALIVGCLLLLPGIGLLLGGGGLAAAYAFGRDDDGYLHSPLTTVRSPSVAVTAKAFALSEGPKGASWVTDALDADIRLRITPSTDAAVFLGVGPAADVDAYLAGSPYEEVTGVAGGAAIYRSTSGTGQVTPPAAQTFWTATATGVGTQQLDWHATAGRWAVVVMNSDGSPGIATSASVDIRAGFVLPLGLMLLGVGLLVTAGAVLLIVVGAGGRRADRATPTGPTTSLGPRTTT